MSVDFVLPMPSSFLDKETYTCDFNFDFRCYFRCDVKCNCTHFANSCPAVV